MASNNGAFTLSGQNNTPSTTSQNQQLSSSYKNNGQMAPPNPQYSAPHNTSGQVNTQNPQPFNRQQPTSYNNQAQTMPQNAPPHFQQPTPSTSIAQPYYQQSTPSSSHVQMSTENPHQFNQQAGYPAYPQVNKQTDQQSSQIYNSQAQLHHNMAQTNPQNPQQGIQQSSFHYHNNNSNSNPQMNAQRFQPSSQLSHFHSQHNYTRSGPQNFQAHQDGVSGYTPANTLLNSHQQGPGMDQDVTCAVIAALRLCLNVRDAQAFLQANAAHVQSCPTCSVSFMAQTNVSSHYGQNNQTFGRSNYNTLQPHSVRSGTWPSEHSSTMTAQNTMPPFAKDHMTQSTQTHHSAPAMSGTGSMPLPQLQQFQQTYQTHQTNPNLATQGFVPPPANTSSTPAQATYPSTPSAHVPGMMPPLANPSSSQASNAPQGNQAPLQQVAPAQGPTFGQPAAYEQQVNSTYPVDHMAQDVAQSTTNYGGTQAGNTGGEAGIKRERAD